MGFWLKIFMFLQLCKFLLIFPCQCFQIETLILLEKKGYRTGFNVCHIINIILLFLLFVIVIPLLGKGILSSTLLYSCVRIFAAISVKIVSVLGPPRVRDAV